MDKKLRVLFIEDSENDMRLLMNELEFGGFDLASERVYTAKGLRDALSKYDWDVIISDHAMPQFNSLSALQILEETNKDIPFIIVSGMIGEEVAVAAMKSGASDYMSKDNLSRLVPSIERELRDAYNRQKRRIMEKALIENEQRTARQRAQMLKREQEARIEAERMRREAENLNRMKDEFLATISHELRTPINVILGFSELLKEKDLTTQEIGDGIDIIYRNAKIQSELISNLLDVSKIISGKPRLNFQSVDLRSIVESEIETGNLEAKAKGIQIRSHLGSKTVCIQGDPTRLEQIIWNLLSNAIKFTSGGGFIDIDIKMSGPRVEVAIRDTGEGIDPSFLPHVFEKFRQQDSSLTRRHGGLGLGLAIVHNLVDLHGGTIRAESRGKGFGSTFIVSFPLETSKQATESRPFVSGATASSSKRSIHGVRLLIVDDCADILLMADRILKRHGAIVTCASSCASALTLLKNSKYDLLVADIGMPGEDGYSLIRKLRHMEHNSGDRLPAIALTAYAQTDDKLKALMAGFDMHLPKPIDTSKLIDAISMLIQKKQNTPKDEQGDISKKNPEETIPPGWA